MLACGWNGIVTAAMFADARDNPTALRDFLFRMPKGGDLHIHLSGGISAERYIAWAVADGLCLRKPDYAIANKPCDPTKAPADSRRPSTTKATYDRIVDALSMRNFRPTAAEPTGHDHFFAAFGKFSAVTADHFEDMVVDLLATYGVQSAQYVELMTSFSWATTSAKIWSKAIAGKPDYQGQAGCADARPGLPTLSRRRSRSSPKPSSRSRSSALATRQRPSRAAR